MPIVQNVGPLKSSKIASGNVLHFEPETEFFTENLLVLMALVFDRRQINKTNLPGVLSLSTETLFHFCSSLVPNTTKNVFVITYIADAT